MSNSLGLLQGSIKEIQSNTSFYLILYRSRSEGSWFPKRYSPKTGLRPLSLLDAASDYEDDTKWFSYECNHYPMTA